MSSNWHTLNVVNFYVCGEDEDVNEPEFPQDFNSACDLLNKLREQNPDTSYTLIAEIDA